MPRKRYHPEEIVAKLRQVDVLTSQGQSVADTVRSIEVTEVTYYRWRRESAGFKSDQVKGFQYLYFGCRMKPGPRSSRICRMATPANRVSMTGLSSPVSCTCSRPDVAGVMCRLRMGRRRQSTTATTDGPGAASGSASSKG